MRRRLVVATLVGLLLATGLIIHQGASGVAAAMVAVGWGIIAVVGVHLLQVVTSGWAWRTVIGPRCCVRTPTFIWLRWIREAVNSLMPMTQVGGEIVSGRLLVLSGMSGSRAGASIVVDLTLEMVGQLAFTLIGLVVLVGAGQTGPALVWTTIGLGVGALAISGFWLAQRWGLFRALERFGAWLALRSSLGAANTMDGLHDAIQARYADRRALATGGALHLLSWLVGAGEVWLILWLMGTPVTLAEALVLESLGQAIRSAAFIMPGGIGVQEGGFLVLGTLFGLAPETGLALSLVKRVREVVLGLPGLLAWSSAEGRHLWLSRARRDAMPPGD